MAGLIGDLRAWRHLHVDDVDVVYEAGLFYGEFEDLDDEFVRPGLF
jgi:hypothetical protein